MSPPHNMFERVITGDHLDRHIPGILTRRRATGLFVPHAYSSLYSFVVLSVTTRMIGWNFGDDQVKLGCHEDSGN
jgi:hypothetical protein